MGAGSWHELSSSHRWYQPHPHSDHIDHCSQLSPLFLGRDQAAERILFLASARGRWLLRRLFERRSLSSLRLLRAGYRPEVFPDRDLGVDQQGIRRDEADLVFILWWYAGFHRSNRRLCNRRFVGLESARAISFQPATTTMGLPSFVLRL